MAYVVQKLVEQYFYLNDDCSGLYLLAEDHDMMI